MDELIAMFDENPNDGDLQEEGESPSPNRRPRSRPPDAPTRNQVSSSSSSFTSKQKSQTTARIAVDDRVGGIQMINRKISSTELEEYINESSFHTAAQLAYYSHELLNTMVLMDSVDLTNPGTPLAGKTRILTVGICLTHSGSRLTAANGQPFAKLEVGTLRTGPTVAVLLFGDAYRVHTRSSIAPGTVIGLRQPRLLPPKPPAPTAATTYQQQRGGSAVAVTAGPRITFAINDVDQLLNIAQARDFGYCHGSCRGKDERGFWVADARPCRNIVDVSVCRFCKEHQKQATKKQGKTNSNLQELKEQTMMMARNQQIVMTSQRKESGGRIMTLPTKAIGRNGGPPGQANSLLNPTVTPPALSTSSTVPFLMMKAPPTAANSRRQMANRFNGSVLVPPPSTIFGRCHQIGHSNLTAGPRERKPDEILDQQKRIAQQVKSGKGQTTTTTTTTAKYGAAASKTAMKLQTLCSTRTVHNYSKVIARTTTTISPQNAFAAAFGPTLDMATEDAVRNARSSFACEAHADEYARSCLALDELETLEAKKRVREQPTVKRLVQIWHCRNCQREFPIAPQACYRRHHTIKVERILRQDDTLSDKRQKRTKADQTDGGLVLGQGLDWSGTTIGNRFIHHY